jgi:DNA-directed RNA polymerase subunit RPC12/RpoP
MQNAPEIDRDNINRFLCENCGANMVFDAKTGGLLCAHCDHVRAVQTTGTVDERDYAAFLERGSQDLQPMAKEAMQVNCDSCGAIVNFTPPETATSCAFCGGKIVAQPKAADPLVAPEGVLPFRVTPQNATSNFNEWLGSLWFAPSKLTKMASADKMASIYIPYWTYDAMTESDYEGQRGENYTDTETYWQNGEMKTRSVTKTRWYAASGHVARHFDDVCVPATTSLPHDYLERLEPWDLAELKSYEPAYLSGHKAQAYQIPLEGGFERFKQVAASVIEQDCRDDIGGDKQIVNTIDTLYSAITFKHLLLPIYAGAYQFGGKTYQIVVNGRTGEVQGGRPYSWVKIGALVLFILLVIIIAVSLMK